MNLPRPLKKFAHLIKEVSDERDTDDGYWVYFVAGYWSPEDETHCIHENTPAECAAKMKSVEPCHCCPGDLVEKP